MDDDEDFPQQTLEKVEVKPEVKKVPQKSPPSKTITAKPINIESSIFNELQSIVDSEISEEAAGKIDWNTVRKFFL